MALLTEQNIPIETVLYLETPPTHNELVDLLKILKITDPRDLIRRGETVYKDLNLANAALSTDDLIQAMIKNPILIERPIVIHNNQARIGRPPETILELF